MAVPGWPDPACSTASIASTRIRSTARWSVADHTRSAPDGLLTVRSALLSKRKRAQAEGAAAGIHHSPDPIGRYNRASHPYWVSNLPGMLTQDPLAVVEGRPYSRGLIIGVAAGLACALIVLAIDVVESVDSAQHSPAPFLVALGLALLPVPLLIALVLLLDRLEPEPPGNLVFCFAWGAGIAALLAGIINTAGLLYVTQPALGKGNGQFVSAAIGAPVVEETLKGLVLVWLLWRRRQELDGPTDGIIYAAMVGLGFAMMANNGYYVSALVRPEVGGVPLLGVTFVFRGVLTPLAHPMFTAMTGIGAAYAATHRRGGWALGAGLAGAIV